MTSDWLAAVLPANQMPGLTIVLTIMGFYVEMHDNTEFFANAYSQYLCNLSGKKS